MKIRLLIFSILAILFACKKDKKCPAFAQGDLSYVPYNAPDTLTFSNGNDSFIYFYIKDISPSESFTQECKNLWGTKDCPCLNYAEVTAYNSKENATKVFFRLEQSDVSDMRYSKYWLFDFYFELDFENELQYANDFDYLDVISNLTIGNVTYNTVAVYSNLNDSESDIQKVYLTKTDGIIRFTMKSTNETWNIVN